MQTTALGLVDNGNAWEDGGRNQGGRSQQKGHVGDSLALDMAGAAAEAVTTAAEELASSKIQYGVGVGFGVGFGASEI